MKERRVLDGWGEIAQMLTEAAGVPISIDQARRYAKRKVNPLPTRTLDRNRRSRRVADVGPAAEWCIKEFG